MNRLHKIPDDNLYLKCFTTIIKFGFDVKKKNYHPESLSFMEKMFCSPHVNFKRVQALLATNIQLTNYDIENVMTCIKDNKIKVDKKLANCLTKIL